MHFITTTAMQSLELNCTGLQNTNHPFGKQFAAASLKAPQGVVGTKF